MNWQGLLLWSFSGYVLLGCTLGPANRSSTGTGSNENRRSDAEPPPSDGKPAEGATDAPDDPSAPSLSSTPVQEIPVPYLASAVDTDSFLGMSGRIRDCDWEYHNPCGYDFPEKQVFYKYRVSHKDGQGSLLYYSYNYEIQFPDHSSAFLDSEGLTITKYLITPTGEKLQAGPYDISNKVGRSDFVKVPSYDTLLKHQGLSNPFEWDALWPSDFVMRIIFDLCKFRISQKDRDVSFVGICGKKIVPQEMNIRNLASFLSTQALYQMMLEKKQITSTEGVDPALIDLMEKFSRTKAVNVDHLHADGAKFVSKIFNDQNLDYAQINTDKDLATLDRALTIGFILAKIKAARLLPDISNLFTVGTRLDQVWITPNLNYVRDWFNSNRTCGYVRYQGTVCHGWSMIAESELLPIADGSKYFDLIQITYSNLGILDPALPPKIANFKKSIRDILGVPQMTREDYLKFLSSQTNWQKTSEVARTSGWILDTTYLFYRDAKFIEFERTSGRRHSFYVRQESYSRGIVGVYVAPAFNSVSSLWYPYLTNSIHGARSSTFEYYQSPKPPMGTTKDDWEFILTELTRLKIFTDEEARKNRWW